ALYREQRESAQVANALLEFASAVVEENDLQGVHERIVERTAAILGVPESSLWLQDSVGGEVRALAVCGLEGELRDQALAFRYSPETSARFVDLPGPFVFDPADYPDVPTFRPADDPFVFAVAPFRFDGERMGFLIAGAPGPAAQFDELALRLLAGLADQARLAL